MIDWLVHSRAGFLTRLFAGITFFLVLAIVDLKKNGSKARRWREYLFLLGCVGIAIVYGVINDQVTSRISWEYFYYGKELERVLGPQTPPNTRALSIEAAKIGIMATWSVGLFIGVALLFANNPRKNSPPLAFLRLYSFLIPVLTCTIPLAVLFGILGWFGKLNWFSVDFSQLWTLDLWRPKHFMCAWGVHLGGYVGGIVGGILSVARLVTSRALRLG